MENLKNTNLSLNFEDREEIKTFINSNESGIYSGKNVDDEEVVVMLQQGNGMNVKTLQSNGWYRVHEYDEDGFFVSETFEK